jgi:hypothetical protein
LTVDKKNIGSVKQFLSKKKIPFAILGKFSGDQIKIMHESNYVIKCTIDIAEKKYFNTLGDILKHG